MCLDLFPQLISVDVFQTSLHLLKCETFADLIRERFHRVNTEIKARITSSIYSGIKVCDFLCFKDNTLHLKHSCLRTQQTAAETALQV